MLKLLDRKVTDEKLARELVTAGLPVKSIAHLSRELDENGRVVLGADGRPKKVPRYLLIKGEFTADEGRAVKAMVDTHVADPEPTEAELAEQRKDAQLNQPEMAGLIKVMAQRMGVTEVTIKNEVKAAMVEEFA